MKRRIASHFYTAKTGAAEITRRRWNVFSIIGKIVRRTCMLLGGLMLFSICLTFILGLTVKSPSSKALPESMILTLNITQPIGESKRSRSLTDPLQSAGMTVEDFSALMDRAAGDKRVHGLVVNLDNAGMELAHIQELRTALHRFRKSGKPAYLYTASFGDLGSGIGAYYFASAFNQIWMQPIGFVMLSGLAIEMPFAKDGLEKLGARAEFLHREEYKSAMESFTNNAMSAPNREMTTAILSDFSAQIFHDIGESRKLKRAQLQAALDQGLITGEAALKLGLVDKLDYQDSLMKNFKDGIAKKTNNGEPEEVSADDYLKSMQKKKENLKSANVALIHIAGEIIPGHEAEPGYATGDYIASAIREAANQNNIRTLVLRVNSPGGSPSASETIRHAIVYAKEKGKKVYISMGPLAASGGYWLSVDADKIFALPTTLTGSIGVIMGKFDISGVWEKVGIHWDTITWGENARLWSMNAPLDEKGRAVLNTAIDSTYHAFLDRVAEGRKIPPEKVRSLAKGRAWTGVQAKRNGLVDELGGLDETLDFAANEMGVGTRANLRITNVPKPMTAIEEIVHMMGQQVMGGDLNLKGLAALRPYLRQAEAIERMGPVTAYDPSLLAIKP